jgi:hypothetical protein
VRTSDQSAPELAASFILNRGYPDLEIRYRDLAKAAFKQSDEEINR